MQSFETSKWDGYSKFECRTWRKVQDLLEVRDHDLEEMLRLAKEIETRNAAVVGKSDFIYLFGLHSEIFWVPREFQETGVYACQESIHAQEVQQCKELLKPCQSLFTNALDL